MATYGVCCRGIILSNSHVTNAKCSGVGVVGYGMVLRKNVIDKNGFLCPVAPPGNGIYMENYPTSGLPSRWDPVIDGNQIVDNGGPGIDVNQVWGGKLTNNFIARNKSWAGVSLYGASYWEISGNTISQPATDEVQPFHPECQGGPRGNHSAGLFLCFDKRASTKNSITTYNTIKNNKISGWYGILLIGDKKEAPYLVPRFNTLTGNDVIGSLVGCGDNIKPGQWQDGQNTWSNNTCLGTPNSEPFYY